MLKFEVCKVGVAFGTEEEPTRMGSPVYGGRCFCSTYGGGPETTAEPHGATYLAPPSATAVPATAADYTALERAIDLAWRNLPAKSFALIVDGQPVRYYLEHVRDEVFHAIPGGFQLDIRGRGWNFDLVPEVLAWIREGKAVEVRPLGPDEHGGILEAALPEKVRHCSHRRGPNADGYGRRSTEGHGRNWRYTDDPVSCPECGAAWVSVFSNYIGHP